MKKLTKKEMVYEILNPVSKAQKWYCDTKAKNLTRDAIEDWYLRCKRAGIKA